MNRVKQYILIALERYVLPLAKTVLDKNKPVIIGITGSVGKTTTKEGLYHVLKEAGLSVQKTEANMNADLGVALSIFGYDHSPAIYEWPYALLVIHLRYLGFLLGFITLKPYFVMEIGIDRMGDMARMMKAVKPTIGILTWIGEGHHLEYFGDAKTVAEEKGLLLANVASDGLSIVPAKDPQLPILKGLAKGKVIEIQETGQAALPAIIRAVADYLKLDRKKIDQLIQDIPKPKGRLSQLAGINGSTIIDDTYNASLPSMKLALETLAQTPGKRKIAILADVLEQGDHEKAVHEEVARLAKKHADLFIGVGKRMKAVDPDQWYPGPDEAARILPELIEEGDVVLVKGSQGMRMEKVSFALAADKEEAKERLVRQGKRWQAIPFSNP